MIRNSELLSKSAITSGTFANRVGLSTEDADRFIDYIVDASFLKNNARVERMKGNTKKLVRLGLGEEVLRPGAYGTAGNSYSDVTTTNITLASKSMKAIVPIADDALLDNIEGEAFADHLMKMVANQIGNQLEYAYLMGQDVGDGIEKTHIWEQITGWYPRAVADGHVIDCTGLSDRYVSTDKLSRAIKTLSSKYRGNRDNLRFIMSDDLYQDFVDIIGNRTTPLGDEAITGEGLLSYGRVPISSCALLPSTLPVHVTAGGSTTLAADADKGDTTISVSSATGLSGNDWIAIGTGATREVRKIAGVDTTTATVSLFRPISVFRKVRLLRKHPLHPILCELPACREVLVGSMCVGVRVFAQLNHLEGHAMTGKSIVAWAQCRQARGQIKLFSGWAEGLVTASLESAIQDAVIWKEDLRTMMSNTSNDVSNAVMMATNSGTSSGEHIPKPWLHGELSVTHQWQRLVSVSGFINVYGISISCLPDPASPPTPPADPTSPMGSVVLQAATYNPPDLYQIGDMGWPRFDFTQTMWLGKRDKPVTPMAVPWTIAQDLNCFPSQWETQSWNVNIPIAKHLLPPSGLSIWAYWNSLTFPRLKVKLITAPT